MAKRISAAKTGEDLDRLHSERVEAYMKSHGVDPAGIGEVFISERVASNLLEEKILLPSFDIPKILSFLPFTKNLYVSLCPNCAGGVETDTFNELVARRAIVPVLIAPYRYYSESILSGISGRDHVSCFEYGAFKYTKLRAEADRGLCAHCANTRADEIAKNLEKSKTASEFKRWVPQVMSNIYPYLYPDYELLDSLRDASRRRGRARIEELVNLSFAIKNVRSSQAFHAPVILSDSDLNRIPQGLATESDEALRISNELTRNVANGLGLAIPLDIPTDKYIELSQEFQPRFVAVIDQIRNATAAKDKSNGDVALAREIIKINGEIERIKGLKRFALLEVGVEFFRNNKSLTTTAFIAGALGLATGIMGCGAGVVAGTVTNLAKKKGLITHNKSAERLGEMVRRDVQPYLDRLIARYVGAYLPAINVLSLKKTITASATKGKTHPAA